MRKEDDLKVIISLEKKEYAWKTEISWVHFCFLSLINDPKRKRFHLLPVANYLCQNINTASTPFLDSTFEKLQENERFQPNPKKETKLRMIKGEKTLGKKVNEKVKREREREWRREGIESFIDNGGSQSPSK